MTPRFSRREATLFTLALTAAIATSSRAVAAGPLKLTHIHGMSYSADGAKLMIPSHDAIAVFEAGKWSKAAGPAHDYMGYSATRDALYSSGHPAPGTGLTNPFGLIKSRDGGKSWQQLGLHGESDFHILATGYTTNAVYVFNHGPNSRMSQAGIFHTTNDGMKWTRASGTGLAGEPKTLAVHPAQASVVAAGTTSGLYLSRNAGDSFERLALGQVLGASFDLDGKSLWFSSYDGGKAALMRIALNAGAQARALAIPQLTQDAVAYIALNPVRKDEMAIATFNRSVFLSKDQGRSWKPIARNGDTLE